MKPKNLTMSPKNLSFSPGTRPLPALLQIKDVAVCGDDVRPVRVVWSDKDGEWSVGLGGLHKLLAHDPAVVRDVLRGLKEWEHARRCAELWGPSRPYKATSWAHLGAVGWLGCEDGALWRGMGDGEGREVKEEREGASTTTTTTTTPPCKPKAPPKKDKGKARAPKRKWWESDSDAGSDNPASISSSSTDEATPPPPPQQETPLPKSKAVPAPKEKGREKKAEGGGKEAGAAKKEEGGDGPPDPLVPTPAHVPYGGRLEVGTVTGVHTRKSGVVWVRYPYNPKLYDVERHLIFGTAEAAEAHLQKVLKGKTPTTNPPAIKPANPPTNPQENPQPNPNTPTNPPSPPSDTELPRHYGTRKRPFMRFKTATMARMAKHMSRKG